MENNTPQPQGKSTMGIAVKGIALIIGLFIFGNVIGSLSNIQYSNTLNSQNNLSTTEPTVSESDTTVPSTEESATALTTTEAPTTTTKPTTTAPTTTEDTTPDSKEEIVAVFNKSANKVKTDAVRVVRNYENLRRNDEMSKYPPIWNIVCGTLMDSWLVDHDTPVEYTESDIIKANFPVKGKDWVSKLTANDVDKARLTDKDGKYYIELDLTYCKNPAEGTGVCAVMEEVNLSKVKALVEDVTKCETEYYDCKIECVIEKETGNMIYAKYTQPMVLNITTQRLRVLEGAFAMSIESEFVIEY